MVSIARRALLSAPVLLAAPGLLRAADQPVRIGLLTNETGTGAASGGTGTVYAGHLAVTDFGGTVLGRPISLVDADFAMKPDTAASIARQWLDTGYDVIADIAMSAAAINVADMAKAAKRIYLATSPATSDLTGTHCSPYTVQWGADSYVLAAAVPTAIMREGGNKWFFITVDYTLGQSLERDMTDQIKRLGGQVVGGVRYPINTTDFAQYLLAAQSSGANVIALATAADMLVNNLKQAHEFGMPHAGQRIVAPLLQQSDMDALGIENAQGLSGVLQFYWNQSDQSRAFSQRYQQKMGVMPGGQHADMYAAITQYLKAVQAAGTTDPDAVMAKLKSLPIDYFGKSATIRADGRLMTDVDVYEVKTPAESKSKFDVFKKVGSLPPKDVYRPMLPACDFAKS
jgi:branched-chain amino acid transport system substrate-binding protein